MASTAEAADFQGDQSTGSATLDLSSVRRIVQATVPQHLVMKSAARMKRWPLMKAL